MGEKELGSDMGILRCSYQETVLFTNYNKKWPIFFYLVQEA